MNCELIHLFNPDNDLALASGLAHYTAPAAALRLRRDGALLPMWYGSPGDRVIAHGVNARWLDSRLASFPSLPGLHDHEYNSLLPTPWGWSAAARVDLLREGCDPALMPSPGDIERLRLLSHRRTSRLLALRLAEKLPDMALPPAAEEVTAVAEAAALMDRWGTVYVKQPWSGSGRGVVCSSPNPRAAVRAAESYIRSQGSAMVEPAMDAALDFARLFLCRDGHALDLGTSVFTTDARGAWTGNLLAPEPVRLARVEAVCPDVDLPRLFAALREAVEEMIAPHYSGVLGVDMLASRDGNVRPVVEVNLRLTMGYAANRFAELHLHPDALGALRVIPLRSRADLPPETYTAEGGRLLSGTLHLCPPPLTGFALVASVNS